MKDQTTAVKIPDIEKIDPEIAKLRRALPGAAEEADRLLTEIQKDTGQQKFSRTGDAAKVNATMLRRECIALELKSRIRDASAIAGDQLREQADYQAAVAAAVAAWGMTLEPVASLAVLQYAARMQNVHIADRQTLPGDAVVSLDVLVRFALASGAGLEALSPACRAWAEKGTAQ